MEGIMRIYVIAVLYFIILIVVFYAFTIFFETLSVFLHELQHWKKADYYSKMHEYVEYGKIEVKSCIQGTICIKRLSIKFTRKTSRRTFGYTWLHSHYQIYSDDEIRDIAKVITIAYKGYYRIVIMLIFVMMALKSYFIGNIDELVLWLIAIIAFAIADGIFRIKRNNQIKEQEEYTQTYDKDSLEDSDIYGCVNGPAKFREYMKNQEAPF